MTQPTDKIPTPLGRRFQRGLKQWLPGIAFLVMCGMCLWLAQFRNLTTVLIGEVEIAEIIIASPQAGIVNQIMPGLKKNESPVYSSVEEGQLIARLDAGTVQQTLDELQAELLGISRSLDVELARIDSIGGAVQATVSSEIKSELSKPSSDATRNEKLANEVKAWRSGATAIERQLKQVDMTRQQLQLREIKYRQLLFQQETDGAGNDDVSTANRNELQRQREALELAVARMNTDLAFDGSDQTGGKLLADIDESGLSATGRSLFRSLRRRCQLAQSQLTAAMKSANSLDIVSPIEGQIDETYVHALQAIVAGTPVASVVPRRSAHVTGYVREHSVLRPMVGMPVVMWSRSDPSLRFDSRVEAVGPKIESIPIRQRANSRVEEWGRPVRIPIPEEMAIQPGSVLEIEFSLHKTSH